jgi:ABC-type lipoprotein release transport system permease subunit
MDLLIGRALTVAVIAALASLYPAWRASRREPAEALHYV